MNVIILTIRQLLVFITRIVRNTLYIPYVTALIFYLFFIFMSVSGLFLSNDTGINFINNLIKLIFDLNENLSFFDPNQSYGFSGSLEEIERLIIYSITGFALIYEFVTRVILFIKKDFDHEAFQNKILKAVRIFYGFTFIISSIIFIFILKEPIFSIALFIILLMNVAMLLLAYKITRIFSFITRIFEK